MCLLCKEIILEKVKPKDFWKNLREITDNHYWEVLEEVTKTSKEYQTKLAHERIRQSEEGDE